MSQLPNTDVWTGSDLFEYLERGEKFFVFDVRNREEFKRFPLEGRNPLPTFNIPYFEMLELGGKDEMLDSVVTCIEQDLANKLPSNLMILAVCAKGDTSEFVAQGLRSLGYDSTNLDGGMKAWGDYYATRVLVETPDLTIYQISRPARGCLSYIVVSAGEAIVIDPLRHIDPYLNLIRGSDLAIQAVIDTHGHADHISGGLSIAAETGAPYYLHPFDAIHPTDVLPATIPIEFIHDGQVFRVGRHELNALHIPGHTLGMVAFKLNDRYLFTGDSIFINSIARPDLGGKAETWAPLHRRSLQRLIGLPGGITVLPGHFSSFNEADDRGCFASSLDDLKRTNEGLIVLQRESEEGFVRYLIKSLPKFIPEYMDIKRVNAGLLTPEEDDAATLELGRNICALSQAYAQSGGGRQ